MNTTYAVLGSHPDLSELELAALLPTSHRNINDQICSLGEISNDLQDLQDKLGGTIKLLVEVGRFKLSDSSNTDQTTSELETELVKVLKSAPTKSSTSSQVNFGLTVLTKLADPSPFGIKKKLSGQGVSARFRDGGDKHGLSAALLLDEVVSELFVFEDQDQLIIAQTKTWQNIDLWSQRDRGRPFADRKRGMLPLKVARMMVNIATKGDTNHHLYDPFCGTGTILQEALSLGISSVGSDLSQAALTGTKENLNWFIAQGFAKTTELPQLFAADVAQVKLKAFAKRPTLIVTEPFLGKPQAKEQDLPNIYKGLYKLYKGAFNTWREILPSGAKVAIVLPRVEVDDKTFSLDILIDELTELGYNIVSGPVRYARPGAQTIREIYLLEVK